jgi:hypothetical protein
MLFLSLQTLNEQASSFKTLYSNNKMSSSRNIFATFGKQINKHYYGNVSPAPSPRVRRSSRLAKKAEIAYEKQVAAQKEQERSNYIALKREIHYLRGRLAEKKRDLELMKNKKVHNTEEKEEVFTPRRSARLATKKSVDYNMFM